MDGANFVEGGMIINVELDVIDIMGDESLLPKDASYIDIRKVDVENIVAFAPEFNKIESSVDITKEEAANKFVEFVAEVADDYTDWDELNRMGDFEYEDRVKEHKKNAVSYLTDIIKDIGKLPLKEDTKKELRGLLVGIKSNISNELKED